MDDEQIAADCRAEVEIFAKLAERMIRCHANFMNPNVLRMAVSTAKDDAVRELIDARTPD